MVLDIEQYPALMSIFIMCKKEPTGKLRYVKRKLSYLNANIKETLECNLSDKAKLAFLKMQKKDAIEGIGNSTLTGDLATHMNNVINTLFKIASNKILNSNRL